MSITEIENMKRVLIVSSCSQTGQLRAVTESIAAPLMAHREIELVARVLEPVTPYPFPWPFLRFFDTFPETVHEVGVPLKPLDIDLTADYDLIILSYQVWFLSPSPPMTAFLQSDAAKVLLRGQRVVTVVACRNMWLMAQERMKAHLEALGAVLADHVALTDRAHPAATFISTPLWLMTGRRGPFWGGLVPPAGIPEADLRGASRFGVAMATALVERAPDNRSPMLRGLGAVCVRERLIASEKMARRSFLIWGRLLRAVGSPGAVGRRCVLLFYILFLITLVCTVVPLSAVLYRLLVPFRRRRLAEEKAYFAAPSGEDVSGARRKV